MQGRNVIDLSEGVVRDLPIGIHIGMPRKAIAGE